MHEKCSNILMTKHKKLSFYNIFSQHLLQFHFKRIETVCIKLISVKINEIITTVRVEIFKVGVGVEYLYRISSKTRI